MKKIYLFLVVVFALQTLSAQNQLSLDYYLPEGSYMQSIPTPKSIIGHEVGEWHITHDKLVEYMYALAESSERISIENRGTTFEGRPLILLTITSPENHENIEQIKATHIAVRDEPDAVKDRSDEPIVVYQGFSIHGNEPSGSNASLAVAYYLAAAESQEVKDLLDDAVILFDPSFNPDGLQRFAYWANTNRSMHINADPNDREYHEVWPGGRTNHYYFDMNRDWLPVQLPESRARIVTFHDWLPNILTDHHEMGTNSSFFFQPGIQSRTHPLTPKMNQTLTKQMGNFHAKALDGIGSLYFTEESFDDFYYGKGSTFPDINGSIGILFEQASSRGHAQESENGLLTFPFTIRNQFTAALSTLEAAKQMRVDILNYQKQFYQDAANQAKSEKSTHLVFGGTDDAARAAHLAEILDRHQIEVYKLEDAMRLDGVNYDEKDSYMVPMNQINTKLIEAMFEKRTTFQDSLFYDISAWTFPLAFDLHYTELKSGTGRGEKVHGLDLPKGKVNSKDNTYAFLMEWNEYYSPKALYAIQKKGIRTKVAMKPFSLEGKSYDYGTVLIPAHNQDMSSADIQSTLETISKEAHVEFDAVSTGLTEGIDLGSRNFSSLNMPKVAMLVGGRVSSYDAGEMWHMMDTRFNIPVTKIDASYFTRVDLSRYNVLILPSGSNLDKNATEKLDQWVRNGGTLIAYRYALNYLKQNKFLNFEWLSAKAKTKDVSFVERGDFRGAQVIGGAIFAAEQDLTHPINFGYDDDHISMFRNTTLFIKASESSYKHAIQYTANPLESGYISKENLEVIGSTLPFVNQSKGRGQVIGFTDNTNFRAFWYGTNKLLMNAIFFGPQM